MNELTVLSNERSQVILVTVDAWPAQLGPHIRLRHGAYGVRVFSAGGQLLGNAPRCAAPAMLAAKEVFLGSLQGGQVATDMKVEPTWEHAPR